MHRMEVAIRRDNPVGMKGVSRSGRQKKPWRARICVNKQHIPLGSFATAKQAHAAYVAAVMKHFGQKAT